MSRRRRRGVERERTQLDALELIARLFVAANRQRARPGRQMKTQAGFEDGDGLGRDRELIVADTDHQQAVAGAVMPRRQEIGPGRQQRERGEGAIQRARPAAATPLTTDRRVDPHRPCLGAAQPAVRRQIEDRHAA